MAVALRGYCLWTERTIQDEFVRSCGLSGHWCTTKRQVETDAVDPHLLAGRGGGKPRNQLVGPGGSIGQPGYRRRRCGRESLWALDSLGGSV